MYLFVFLFIYLYILIDWSCHRVQRAPVWIEFLDPQKRLLGTQQSNCVGRWHPILDSTHNSRGKKHVKGRWLTTTKRSGFGHSEQNCWRWGGFKLDGAKNPRQGPRGKSRQRQRQNRQYNYEQARSTRHAGRPADYVQKWKWILME